MWLLTLQMTFSTAVLIVTTSAETNRPRVLNSKYWNYPYKPSQLLVQCCAYHCNNGRSQFDDCECSKCTPRPQYYKDKHGSLVKVLYSDDYQGQGHSIRQQDAKYKRNMETDKEKPLDTEDYVLIIVIIVLIPTAIVLFCFVACVDAIWKKYRSPDVNSNSKSKEKPGWTATGIAGGKRFKTVASASHDDNSKMDLNMANVQHEEGGLERRQIGRPDGTGASEYNTKVVGRPPRSTRVTANASSEAVCLEVVEIATPATERFGQGSSYRFHHRSRWLTHLM